MDECARYLETLKSYEKKSADGISERVDNDYLSRVSVIFFLQLLSCVVHTVYSIVPCVFQLTRGLVSLDEFELPCMIWRIPF